MGLLLAPHIPGLFRGSLCSSVPNNAMQGKEVEYSLRLLPLGGFVAFPDDDPESPYPGEHGWRGCVERHPQLVYFPSRASCTCCHQHLAACSSSVLCS